MTCSNIKAPLHFAIPCGPEIRSRITKVFMDDLGNVYDQDRNYLGHGTFSSPTTVNVDSKYPEIKLLNNHEIKTQINRT